MTNAKVYQGFRDDKKLEEHWATESPILPHQEQIHADKLGVSN